MQSTSSPELVKTITISDVATAREYREWVKHMEGLRDQVTANGRRTEAVARFFALLYGRKLDLVNKSAGEYSAAEKSFTSPAKWAPRERPAFEAVLTELATPVKAPVVPMPPTPTPTPDETRAPVPPVVKEWAAVRMGEACWLSDRPAGPVEPAYQSAAEWPAWTDAERWEPTEAVPSEEDLRWAAAVFNATEAIGAGLVPADLPVPADRRSLAADARPVRVRRPAMTPISDYDKSLCGAV